MTLIKAGAFTFAALCLASVVAVAIIAVTSTALDWIG